MTPENADQRSAVEQVPSPELAAIQQMAHEAQDHLRCLAADHPELTIAENIFAQSLKTRDRDTVSQSISSIILAYESVLLQLKNVINPTGLPLDVTPDGRIKSKTFRSAAVISTDIADFTPLSLDVPRVMDTDIFDVLSYTYYPHLMEVLKKYDCNLYSFAGDGTMILSREKLNKNGRVILPALENAVLCAAEASLILSIVADVWKELGLHNPDGTTKRTRFGIKFGSVTIGDALAPDANPAGMCEKFNQRFREVVKSSAPDYGPPEDFSMRIWGVNGISPVQNHAARLQSCLEDPAHICALALEDVQQLCSPIQKRFSKPASKKLKGLDYTTEVCVLPALGAEEIAELSRACRAYYETHETYH